MDANVHIRRGSTAAGLNPPPARQVVLPLLGQVVRHGSEDGFAHPAERELARLLTFYGVRWAYEPTTFALSRGDDGAAAEAFTPDFYLPDHRLYIELTTMRQRLVTRKNRKLRRLRELYPEVGVKLLYRRDYLQLVDAYDPFDAETGEEQIGQVLFAEAEIAARIEVLADQIAADLGPDGARPPSRPPVLIGVGPGSGRFHAALTAALDRRTEIARDWIDLTRFVRTGRGRARVQRAPALDLTGRRVVLVEDVVSTGLSLAYLVGWLRRRGVREVAACTLLDRSGARLVEVPVRHVGFSVSAALLVGFGLSRRRQYGDLPYIATIVPIAAPS